MATFGNVSKQSWSIRSFCLFNVRAAVIVLQSETDKIKTNVNILFLIYLTPIPSPKNSMTFLAAWLYLFSSEACKASLDS